MRYLSVCSGIEAASCAWHPLGWEAVAFSEIEPFPCRVLQHRFPDVPNLGDMTKINGENYRGSIDLLVGGTPCQDFSVAGKRAGLDGERSGLARDFTRLLREIRPRWFLWENVPGAFSTHSGRDFGTLLGALDELGYGLAWRVLDAQFWGVPQRRRRIFLVGHLGDFRPAGAVLFEPASLCRDTPKSGKKREGVTQSLTGCLGRGGPDDNRAQAGFYVPEIVDQAMSCKWSKGTSGPAGDEHHNLVVDTLNCRPYADNAGQESRLVIHQDGERKVNASSQERNASAILRVLREEIGEEAFAKWGLGILIQFQQTEILQQKMHECGIRYATFSRCWMVDCALSCEKGNPSWLLHSLRETECQGCPPQGWKPSEQLSRELGTYMSELSLPGTQEEKFMQDMWSSCEGCGSLRETLSTVQKIRESILDKKKSALRSSSVRRLTVTECEFLMGFPRNYTRIDWCSDTHERCSDTARYKALGNSMAVPVMRWIGERIERVERQIGG